MTRSVSLTPAVFHLPEAVNRVSATYGASPITPRGPRMKPLFDRVLGGIPKALKTPNHEAVLMTGTGSTAIAAVLGSCLEPEERLLVVRNGAYGDRILEFANTLHQPVVDLPAPYGEHPDLARIEEIFATNLADAVAIVHGATSSCTLNPVAKVAALARKYQKKVLMDGVSSLFVEEVDVEGWGVDAVMGSCNKGLHSHPNLTFALVRTTLLREMEHIAPRAPNLELYKTWQTQKRAMHPYTLDPMSLSQAAAALDYLEEIGGVAARHAMYEERCAVLRPGYEALGLEIARWPGVELQSIGTALRFPKGRVYEDLSTRLANDPVDGYTFDIYSAQGRLSDKLFRVFHMGEYPLDAYRTFLKALARVV